MIDATVFHQDGGIHDIDRFVHGACEEPGTECRREQMGVLGGDFAAECQAHTGRDSLVPLREETPQPIHQVEVTTHRSQRGRIDGRRVDRMLDLAAGEIGDQQFAGFHGHLGLRLIRARAQVRRDQAPLLLEQWMLLAGFFGKNIERNTGDPSRLQRPRPRPLRRKFHRVRS